MTEIHFSRRSELNGKQFKLLCESSSKLFKKKEKTERKKKKNTSSREVSNNKIYVNNPGLMLNKQQANLL